MRGADSSQLSSSNLGEVLIADEVIVSGPSPRRARSVILLLAASVGLMMTGFGIIMPIFARRLGEFGSGVEALGLMTMSFALAQLVAAPFMGSLADRSMDQVWLAAPFMVAGWLLVGGTGRALDALALGDETAMSLGVDLPRTRLKLILGTALSVGGAVAVSGTIGFVGLVVPHLLRPFVGYQPSTLLPASALGGAILLLLADVAVRVVPTEAELRLGVLTALIGVPFFLGLILKTRREMA